MNQGIKASFDLPLLWIEQSILSVIPQQEKGNPLEELQLHYQFLFLGVSQNSFYKNMFVFEDQYSLRFKLATTLIFWTAKHKIQEVLRSTWRNKYMSANKIINLNRSAVIQIMSTSTAINFVGISFAGEWIRVEPFAHTQHSMWTGLCAGAWNLAQYIFSKTCIDDYGMHL